MAGSKAQRTSSLPVSMPEMPERTRVEQILKQQCFILCSQEAMIWDEALACPNSLEVKLTAPLPSTLSHSSAAGCVFNREKKGKTCFS